MSTAVGRRLGRAATARPSLESVRRYAVRQRLRYRTWRRCGHAYAAPIDPGRILRVDPGAISHALPRERRDALEHSSSPHVQAVEGGDWDLGADRFVETTCYQSLRERFREDVPWHETDYAAVLERDTRSRERNGWDDAVTVSDGLARHRAESLRLRERYAALESIFDRATTDGVPSRATTDGGRYRTDPATVSSRSTAADSPGAESSATSIGATNRGAASGDWLLEDPRPVRTADLPPSKSVLQVNVGRDGRLLLHRGRHGLAIARLADLETVPVHVLVRHERWQARRDRLVLTGTDDGDHPDLAGLAPV